MIAAAFWQTNNTGGGTSAGVAPVITNNITSSIVNTFPTTITVTVLGIPTPVFSWTKDGVPIGGETGTSITVNGVGSYVVTVTNPSGTVTSGTSVIYYSPDPIFHVRFIYYNASTCNLSYVENPVINGYVDLSDPPSFIAQQNGNYNVQTPNATVNYTLNDTVMTTTFRDNCVNDIYISDTTQVFSLTRYYYNSFYNDETELYECKDPVEIGTTNRVVGLNDLARSIKTQYEQSLIPPYPVIPLGSPGNPFTHTIGDS
jgi:hypothetical protein